MTLYHSAHTLMSSSGHEFSMVAICPLSWMVINSPLEEKKKAKTCSLYVRFFPPCSWEKLVGLVRVFISIWFRIGLAKPVVPGLDNVYTSPWSSECKAILLASQAHSRSIDNWHEFFNVRGQHTIEKLLIPVLQGHQQYVSVELEWLFWVWMGNGPTKVSSLCFSLAWIRLS